MNVNQDSGWERRVDRELKALPEMQAPASIRRNVMSTIRARAAVPWYRRGWQAWPAAFQYALIALLMMALGTIYWALGRVEHPEQFAQWAGQGSESLAVLKSFLNVLGTLVDAAVILLGKLGTPLLLTLIGMAVLGYIMCLALGTAMFRLAMARR